MTKAELIDALQGVPNDTPLYFLEESTATHLDYEINIVGKESHEIHINIK